MEGGDDRGGEATGEQREEDTDKTDEVTQRILNIMANFLEGEVRETSLHNRKSKAV